MRSRFFKDYKVNCHEGVEYAGDKTVFLDEYLISVIDNSPELSSLFVTSNGIFVSTSFECNKSTNNLYAFSKETIKIISNLVLLKPCNDQCVTAVKWVITEQDKNVYHLESFGLNQSMEFVKVFSLDFINGSVVIPDGSDNNEKALLRSLTPLIKCLVKDIDRVPFKIHYLVVTATSATYSEEGFNCSTRDFYEVESYLRQKWFRDFNGNPLLVTGVSLINERNGFYTPKALKDKYALLLAV